MQLVKAETPVTPTVESFKAKTVRGKLWAVLPWGILGIACVLVVVGMICPYTDANFTVYVFDSVDELRTIVAAPYYGDTTVDGGRVALVY